MAAQQGGQPAGVKVDILQYDDGENEDETWDAVWDLQVARGDFGWSAELRIPFGMPTVEIDSERCPRPSPEGAVSTRTESRTAPRLRSGSPIPM
jgi:hypothetical protein